MRSARLGGAFLRVSGQSARRRRREVGGLIDDPVVAHEAEKVARRAAQVRENLTVAHCVQPHRVRRRNRNWAFTPTAYVLATDDGVHVTRRNLRQRTANLIEFVEVRHGQEPRGQVSGLRRVGRGVMSVLHLLNFCSARARVFSANRALSLDAFGRHALSGAVVTRCSHQMSSEGRGVER